MLLGVETGIGIASIGAISALRLATVNIAPKRVRVVTDIDDTVKSSGNKRLLGIPLGGIDAQCKGDFSTMMLTRKSLVLYSSSK